MNRLLILIFFTLIFSNRISSQTKKIDSSYLEKINYYKNINNDSTLFYINKIRDSKHLNYTIPALSVEAYVHYRKKDFKKSEEIALKLLHITNESLLKSNHEQFYYDGIISAYNRLFWIKKNEENYSAAYSYLDKMEEANESTVFKTHKYIRHKTSIKVMRAIIKRALKLDSQAKQLLLEAYNESNNYPVIIESKDNEFFLQQKANISNNLGNIYLYLAKQEYKKEYIDSASYFYDKAYEAAKNFKPLHKDSEIIYNFRKTEVLMAQKEYQKAIDVINNYKNISNGFHYFHREYFQKAICFHNLNEPDSAIYYSNKLLKDHKKCETSKLITIYDILSEQYNKLNKLDSAFKYSKLTLEQHDIARKNKEKTFNLFYNNSFNKAQELNETIKNRETKKQRNLVFSFTFLLLTLITITIYIFKGERKKKKELLFKINENKPNETERKEYNIDEELERKILNEFKNTSTNQDFLKPDFSINYIAEKLNTNTTYVSFVFNKHNEESFKQYSTRLKIDYVVEKLKTDKLFRKYSIQAIAEEIGYTNASAFTRAFKKQTGVTPSIFLKNLED